MKKLLLLVGGSAGLGEALYSHYKNMGYDIVEFSRSGQQPEHVFLDMSRKETAIDTIDLQFAQLAKQPWQEIVLIINAAQIGPIGELAMSEPKQWWQNIEVNLTLPISIMGRFQTHFQAVEAPKNIAFVSSGAATSVIEGWSLYSATKAGVEHFIRVVAQEQSSKSNPITPVILNPGIMDTQMQATIRSSSEAQFSNVDWFKQAHETGQLASPATVAGNIAAVLSGKLEAGQVYDVSG
ncbi:SDR family NAD(P)-dependent oxidoreductase [Reinekea forsetii]|nr:SDR family NAD(P)-dependent oxidoreductase [Reinekea forsetii]